jgi:NitT/TauT family transport system substrate-binding protein
MDTARCSLTTSGQRPPRCLGPGALARVLLVAMVVLAGCSAPAAAPASKASSPAAPASAPAASAPGAAASAPAPTAIARLPLTVSYSALTASQAPVWIAQELGLYDRYGLDVNLHYISSVQQTVAALLSGEVDVGIVGGTGVIAANLSGSDLATFAGTKNQLAGRIMAHPDVRDVADLKGKRVGMTRRGGNSHYMGMVALQRYGLEPERDVFFVGAGGTPEIVAALSAGAIDAGVMVSPGDFVAEARGYKSILDMTPMAIPYPATQSSARRTVLAAKDEAIWRYVQALADGVRIYKDDRDRTLQVIAEYTKMDDRVALEAAYEIERAIMASDLRPDPKGVEAAMEEVAFDEPRVRDTRPEDYLEFRFVDRLAAARR